MENLNCLRIKMPLPFKMPHSVDTSKEQRNTPNIQSQRILSINNHSIVMALNVFNTGHSTKVEVYWLFVSVCTTGRESSSG